MPRKILIVDDAVINRQLLRKMLSEEYEILEAENGREALAVLYENYQHLSAVLLDIVMPVMDGHAVLEKMRSDPDLAQIPVIVTTGNTEGDAEIKALTLGANDFIVKPYIPEIIKRRLKNTINLRETAATVNELQRDKLTGLYNRETFFQKATEMIQTRPPGYYVMSCFDIDNFKVINDQYGNRKGDEILKQVAQIFREGFDAAGGLVGRIMADNYAILYPASLMDSSELARIREETSVLDGSIPPISFSVGRYVVDDLSLSASGMYDRAVLAENTIKGRFDADVALYDETMREQLLKEQEIVNEMRRALTERQFEVWLQPQYNHSSGALIGAEALVRWRRPKKGLVFPGGFIPVFERNGFIYELDKYVWEQTCRLLRNWLDEGRSPLPVSVNVSRYDLFREDLIETITSLISKYGIPRELLRLEITESAFAETTEQIIDVVMGLIDCGFTVEIDDFGSGYSSLNTLKDVPAQILKMDMRFLENDRNTDRGGNILESVVRMAKWLGMSVIAEGVETRKQADYLKSIGCNYVQGYLYAKPMPAEEYERLAESADKEEKLTAMETVENLDNNSFWDPESMDTLIFNTYVGGACIFEWYRDRIEILRANEKYAKTIGGKDCTMEDALSLVWEDHMDEAAAKATRDAIEEAIETGEEATYEATYFDLLGNPGETCLRTTFRVIARAGNRYLLYATNENITAQRRAEKERNSAAQQLQAVMDNVASGITAVLLKDDKMEHLFSNNRYYEMHGYTKEQFQSEVRNVYDLFHPDDRERVREAGLAANEIGKTATLEYRAIRRDGKEIWIRVVLSTQTLEGVPHPVQFSVCTDITAEKVAGLYGVGEGIEEYRKAFEQLKRVQEEARMREEQFRIAAAISGMKIARYDIRTGVYSHHDEILLSLGFAEDIENMPQAFLDAGLIVPEYIEAYLEFYGKLGRGERSASLDTAIFGEGGAVLWIHADATVIFDGNGTPIEAIIVFYDVTEMREKEAVYRKWQQSLQQKPKENYTLIRLNLSKSSFFSTVEGSLLHLDPATDLNDFSARTQEYTEQFVYREDREEYRAFLNTDILLANYYRGIRAKTLEYREMQPENAIRWLRLTVELVEYPNSEDVQAYLLYEDIDENKKDELRNKERAQTDPLTGVLNRTAFAQAMEHLIAGPNTTGSLALMMLDIDGFKRINDTFGHVVGDQVLLDAAKSLRSVLRHGDLIGRLGGDEFLVCLPDMPEDLAIESKAMQICGLLHKSLSPEIDSSVSIGIAVYPRDGKDFDTLYRNVDIALYTVKDHGKNSYAFFREGMKID